MKTRHKIREFSARKLEQKVHVDSEGRDETPERFCSSVPLYYWLNHEVQQLRRKEANRHES